MFVSRIHYQMAVMEGKRRLWWIQQSLMTCQELVEVGNIAADMTNLVPSMAETVTMTGTAKV